MSCIALPAYPIDDGELASLLDAVFAVYGYDFREYSLPSIKRRVAELLRAEGLPSVIALRDHVVGDSRLMRRLSGAVSVHVSSMYRNPQFYQAFRSLVVPRLRTYPFIRIWHAGCSTGEEVYSMAILLQEEGLYDRCKIYATDMNDVALERARSGIYPMRAMQQYTTNYIDAGGAAAFSDYYTAMYGNAIMRQSLKENIVFAQHNLAHDGPFNEFHAVLCRNVMIYFNRTLQARVHGLLHDSLVRFGYLGLGQSESLTGMPLATRYKEVDGRVRLYRRTA